MIILNNSHGYFCERKTINEFDEDDFMSSRVANDNECDEEIALWYRQ